MADNTKIEWADASWNPIRARNRETGKIGHYCEHLSPGCVHCYSETFNRDKVELFLDETMLTQPLRWKKPRRIFPCSMTDLFADFVPDEWIDRIFAVMALCPQHTFTPLTKRADRMRKYLIEAQGNIWDALRSVPGKRRNYVTTMQNGNVVVQTAPRWPLPNVILGVSVEDQLRADERIPHLLATPAAKRFLSCEPLLSELNIAWALSRHRIDIASGILRRGQFSPGMETLRPIDWVITGGESGPGARPMHPDWARSLRDQCQAADVPFFFKQWGGWIDAEERRAMGFYPRLGRPMNHDEAAALAREQGYRVEHQSDGTTLIRVGKKAAGRLLDGREWSEMPA